MRKLVLAFVLFLVVFASASVSAEAVNRTSIDGYKKFKFGMTPRWALSVCEFYGLTPEGPSKFRPEGDDWTWVQDWAGYKNVGAKLTFRRDQVVAISFTTTDIFNAYGPDRLMGFFKLKDHLVSIYGQPTKLEDEEGRPLEWAGLDPQDDTYVGANPTVFWEFQDGTRIKLAKLLAGKLVTEFSDTKLRAKLEEETLREDLE